MKMTESWRSRDNTGGKALSQLACGQPLFESQNHFKSLKFYQGSNLSTESEINPEDLVVSKKKKERDGE